MWFARRRRGFVWKQDTPISHYFPWCICVMIFLGILYAIFRHTHMPSPDDMPSFRNRQRAELVFQPAVAQICAFNAKGTGKNWALCCHVVMCWRWYLPLDNIGHVAAQALHRWVNSLMCHCLRNCSWLVTHSIDSWDFLTTLSLFCHFSVLSLFFSFFPSFLFHLCPTFEWFAEANHSRGPRERGENQQIHKEVEFNSLLDLLHALDGVGSTLIIYSILFNLIVTECYLAEVFVKPYNSEIASKMEVALSERAP